MYNHWGMKGEKISMMETFNIYNVGDVVDVLI